MNVHHLELFFYVARHGGISPAVRKMPYGIQQPAVSGQILQLEEYLGASLFQRRPFLLTPQGEELYAFIRPFFEGLEPMAARLRGGAGPLLRVAASTVVLRHHFPELLQHLRRRHPGLRLSLREGLQPQMEGWLDRQEIDFAVTVLEGRPGAGIKTESLIRLPVALLVAAADPLRRAEELWARDRIDRVLVSLPAEESISRHFQRALARRGREWPVGIEVSSLDLVETYVARGFGVGLVVEVPGISRPAGVRLVPLADVPPVEIGALWRGRLGAVALDFLGEIRIKVREILADS